MSKNNMIARSAVLIAPMTSLFVGCTDNTDNGLSVNPETNKDGKYNIVFITTDQEAYMESYPAGSDYQARERLRKIGTTFEKHYACSNVSTSSRSVIYTGRHITETKMLDNTNMPFQPNMDKNLKTVGDMLREAGYYTAFKGKWHISENDTSLEEYGFSDWSEGNMFGSQQEGYHEDANIAKEACDWLDTTGKEKNENGQSFFLAVNFINPHDIMYFDAGGKDGFVEAMPAPDAPVYQKSYPIAVSATWNEALDKPGRPSAHKEYFDCWNNTVGDAPTTEEGWKKFVDYYFNCIQDCDNQLAKLLDKLEENDMMKNTIIIYTSDHGEMMGAHGLKGKGGFLYENNIHVPLIIYHPEYEGGSKRQHLTSHLDLAPTFVDIATTNDDEMNTITAGLKGHSIMPMLADPNVDIRDGKGVLFAFEMISVIDSEAQLNPIKFDLANKGFVRGIITPSYKFARYFSPLKFNMPADLDALYADNEVELYEMGMDETENLAYPKGNNETLVKEYNDKLNALIREEIGNDDGSETDVFPGGLMNYAK